MLSREVVLVHRSIYLALFVVVWPGIWCCGDAHLVQVRCHGQKPICFAILAILTLLCDSIPNWLSFVHLSVTHLRVSCGSFISGRVGVVSCVGTTASVHLTVGELSLHSLSLLGTAYPAGAVVLQAGDKPVTWTI